MQIRSIDARSAYEKLQTQQAYLIDIRDPQAYQASHVPDSFHVTQDNWSHVLQQFEYDTPLIIMCYHGISSQNVATYLLEQGFEEIYNLEGGFAAWEKVCPTHTPSKDG